ncbi:hypothetical protein ACWEKT_33145 [Nocardia takedensis]
MKRILSATAVAAPAAVVATGFASGNAGAETFSSSNSGSCSGTVRGWGDFYAYTYQYARIANDKITSENHNFHFTGFLKGADDAKFVAGRRAKWMVYRSGSFDIAVPYVEGAGLFARDNRDRDNDWVKLCSY